MAQKFAVNNVDRGFEEHPYTVIRDCRKSPVSPGYWYYGAYDDLQFAQEVCREIRNGVVVTPDQVEVVFYN